MTRGAGRAGVHPRGMQETLRDPFTPVPSIMVSTTALGEPRTRSKSRMRVAELSEGRRGGRSVEWQPQVAQIRFSRHTEAVRADAL